MASFGLPASLAFTLVPTTWSDDDDSSEDTFSSSVNWALRNLQYREPQFTPSGPSMESDGTHIQPSPESTSLALSPQHSPPTRPTQSRMADSVPTFRGDGSSGDPKPQLFFNKCESFLMDRQLEYNAAKQMRWFKLKLEPGSEVEEWYDVLDAADKQDMDTLRPFFDTAFPPDPKATKTVQDKWDRLLKHILVEDRMLDIDEDSVYVYVKWGMRMLTLSKGIDDANGLQAGQLRDQLPRSLRKLVGEVSSFRDLATKVQGVRKKALEEAVEDRAEVA